MNLKLYGALLYHQKVLCEKTLSENTIVLGRDAQRCDFVVDLPEFESPFKLIDGGTLHLKPTMCVTMSCGQVHYGVGDVRATPSSGEESYAFSQDDWAIVNLSPGLDFVVCFKDISSSPMPLAAPFLSLTQALESPAARLLVLSFALHSMFIFLASWTSETVETTEYQGLESRWVELLSDVEEHTEEEKPPEEPQPVIEDVDNVIIDESMKNLDRPKIDDSDSKIANLDKVEKPVGIQAALGGAKLHDMASLFGSSAGLGNALDFMPETAEGDAFGTGAGFGAGLSGLGVAGGGGGGGYGAGIGGMGGGGAGGGGSAKVSGPKKSGVSKKPKLAMDPPKQGAFCKESNIRDVVQKRANALRNCYEQQLLANPDLSGKIVVFWKIGLDGKVSEASIKSTTMNNARVESCLTQTVRRLRFDKPDGGICVVEFPFIFTSAQ